MAGTRIHVVMDDELLGKIDAARADGVSRGHFIRRKLEAALSDANGAPTREQSDPAPVPSPEGVRSAAPPRTSPSPSLARFGGKGPVKPRPKGGKR